MFMGDLQTSEQLVQSAHNLQNEAGRILDELGLMQLLSDISEPILVGSVKNGLMVKRDIDIHAHIKEYDLKKIAQLLPRLAQLATIQKVQFDNYRELRRDYRKDRAYFPHAYYVGLRTLQPSGEWKIDMWFGKEGEIECIDTLLEKLTNEQRGIILNLKQLLVAGSGYKDGVMSMDIYKGVLDCGVKNEADFKEYLNNKAK